MSVKTIMQIPYQKARHLLGVGLSSQAIRYEGSTLKSLSAQIIAAKTEQTVAVDWLAPTSPLQLAE